MHHLHIISYNDFAPDELCHYLEERHYTQILQDLETAQKYLEQLTYEDQSVEVDLIHTLFQKLYIEVKQLFVKDRILLFPHIVSHEEKMINLVPINLIHQRIMDILRKLRGMMNNYIQQPSWSNQFKICCNELYSLEQSIQHVLYIKENFLWTKINTAASNEC